MSSEQGKANDMSPQERPATRQWNLSTLFLLTAMVGLWTGNLCYRQQLAPLKAKVDRMRQMVGTFTVGDLDLITVASVESRWWFSGWRNEDCWNIYLPQGDYVLRLSTREIRNTGLAPVLAEVEIPHGSHQLRLRQFAADDGPRVTVFVNGEPLIETAESPDWATSSSSGETGAVGQYLPADQSTIVLRRRFLQPLPNGSSQVDYAANGLLLWIEPVTSVDSANEVQ